MRERAMLRPAYVVSLVVCSIRHWWEYERREKKMYKKPNEVYNKDPWLTDRTEEQRRAVVSIVCAHNMSVVLNASLLIGAWKQSQSSLVLFFVDVQHRCRCSWRQHSKRGLLSRWRVPTWRYPDVGETLMKVTFIRLDWAARVKSLLMVCRVIHSYSSWFIIVATRPAENDKAKYSI